MQSTVLARSSNVSLPVLVRGHGAYVFDDRGNQYLGGMGGVAVNIIGHGVAEVTRAMATLEDKAFYSYAQEFTNPWQEEFATRLLQVTKRSGSVYFASGGSEANEMAVKFARQYHVERGEASRWKVISRDQAYHGNTLGMLSLSGRPSWRSAYDPYLFYSPTISPLNTYRPAKALDGRNQEEICAAWVDEFERLLWREDPRTVAAFIFEPISGASIAGAEPPPGYYDAVLEICRQNGIITIADEVFVGYGRTGKVLSGDHFGVDADIVTLAKGIGSGYAALSACLLSQEVTEEIRSGSGRHTQGYTFSGLPVGSFIGLRVLDYIEKNDLFARSAEIGAHLHESLARELGVLPAVGDLRGRGVLAGIELVQDRQTKKPFPRELALAGTVAKACREKGLIIFPGAPDVAQHLGGDQLHLAPPFVITEEDVGFIVGTLRDAITEATDRLV